jgi:hypothetical protein
LLERGGRSCDLLRIISILICNENYIISWSHLQHFSSRISFIISSYIHVSCIIIQSSPGQWVTWPNFFIILNTCLQTISPWISLRGSLPPPPA